MIVLWSGAVVDVPTGWHLCDGAGGTPDLRNKFIVGAGSTYAPNATGGALTHTHTGTTNGHKHTLATTFPAMPSVVPMVYDIWTDQKTDTFTTQAGSSLPPYYALCYIMKV